MKLDDGVVGSEANFFSEVKQDLIANGWDNSKFGTALRLVVLDLGVQLLLHYRLQVRFLRVPVVGKILARVVGYFSQIITACQISSTAHLEGGIIIPHPSGIVIGRGAIVGSGVAIYQQVTLGIDKKGKSPVVGEGVTIFSGAKIIGGVQLGDDSIIGANSVVITDVAVGAIVAGVPSRVIGCREG